MKHGEVNFNPPHGIEVFDVIFDGVHLSFLTGNGIRVDLRGSMRFYEERITDDEDIPERVCGIFIGDYAVDDFVYPVEVHFEDTYGRIYERPRMIPECCFATDVCASYLTLTDPAGHEFVCIREPNVVWKPTSGKAVGRIGHLLFVYL